MTPVINVLDRCARDTDDGQQRVCSCAAAGTPGPTPALVRAQSVDSAHGCSRARPYNSFTILAVQFACTSVLNFNVFLFLDSVSVSKRHSLNVLCTSYNSVVYQAASPSCFRCLCRSGCSESLARPAARCAAAAGIRARSKGCGRRPPRSSRLPNATLIGEWATGLRLPTFHSRDPTSIEHTFEIFILVQII